MPTFWSRRRLVAGSAAGLAAAALPRPAVVAKESRLAAATPKLRYCLNTATIRGQKLSIVEQIEIVAAAGYDGIEPWIRDIQLFVESGGKLVELRTRLEDHGLKLEGAIGFPRWIDDDEAVRRQALEQAKREMHLVRELGGRQIAAPPAGATKVPLSDLRQAAQRYRALLERGRQLEVTPVLELWGFSKTLSRMSLPAMNLLMVDTSTSAIFAAWV